MARPKKQPNPIIAVARAALDAHAPELTTAPIELRQLDGPPDGPRFAVTVEQCLAKGNCPHHVSDSEHCPIRECDMRASARMLFARDGQLLTVSRGHVRRRS